MTNWQDPARIAADYLVLIKLVHVSFGIVIWELVINLQFDISVLTGKRKFRWTFLIYLACRWSLLPRMAVMLFGLDSRQKMNCKGWVVSVFSFGYLSAILASALIVLRIAAIWECNKFAVGLASSLWLATVGTCLHSAISVRSVRSPLSGLCVIVHVHQTLTAFFFVTLITDVVLLVLMLGGLLRWTSARHAGGGILRLLYNQGLAWLAIVSLAKIPPAVFVILDLNDAMSAIFLVSALVAMSIGASHLHRSLAEYPSSNAPGAGGTVSGLTCTGGRFVFAHGIGGEQLVSVHDTGDEQSTVYAMDSHPMHGLRNGDDVMKFRDGSLA
ncbi:hypothetical protein BC834DRAFT_658359 [Gloeopeniophorella convolvens]|nr:hypothetical protein BC834DRAFT_658359 [Gloeopeniophorella convolvens]